MSQEYAKISLKAWFHNLCILWCCIVIEYVDAKNIWMIHYNLWSENMVKWSNFVDRLYYTGIAHNAMPILNILQMECKTWSRNHSRIDPVNKPCIQIYGQNRAEDRTIIINVSKEKALGKTKWSNQQKQSINHRQQIMHLPKIRRFMQTRRRKTNVYIL